MSWELCNSPEHHWKLIFSSAVLSFKMDYCKFNVMCVFRLNTSLINMIRNLGLFITESFLIFIPKC